MRATIHLSVIGSLPVWSLILPLAATEPVHAGPNSNGAIVVHTDDAYLFDDAPCDWAIAGPCPELETQIDTIQPSPGNIVWFLAAFVPGTVSDVATVYFGVNWDYTALKVGSTAKGPCGTGLEVPDTGWPGNTNGLSGDTWGFDTPQTSTLFRFYWFGLRPKTGSTVPAGSKFCSAVNPTGGYASFISSGLAVDPITQFGCVRYQVPGNNDCPAVLPKGACCAPSGSCTLTAEIDCAGHSVWHSEWTTCDPLPNGLCQQLTGACCAPDGSCTLIVEIDCAGPSIWHGEWTSCDPLPNGLCSPLPAPTHISPVDAAICVPTTGVLDWSDVSGASAYGVKIGVACDAGVENVVTASRFSFTGLSPSTTYFWHVRTKNVLGIWGPYSECTTFTTAPALLAAPTLEVPADGATDQPAAVTLDWSDVANAAGYRVQLGTSPGSGYTHDVTLSEDHYSNLELGMVYYWRVQTKDACGNYGAYTSTSFSFTTAVPPGTGACCTPDGLCTLTAEIDCPALFVWHGQWTSCDPRPNGQCPEETGACCAPSDLCTMTTRAACLAPNTWLGAWIDCDPLPNGQCSLPRGACCDPKGYCYFIPEVECPVGFGFYWDGEIGCEPPHGGCRPVEPTGACCDFLTGDCEITWEGFCTFTWLGLFTSCTSQTCPVPSPKGACCNPDTGECSWIVATACPTGWTWLTGAACEPSNPCPPPVPTKDATWGQVKSIYR